MMKGGVRLGKQLQLLPTTFMMMKTNPKLLLISFSPSNYNYNSTSNRVSLLPARHYYIQPLPAVGRESSIQDTIEKGLDGIAKKVERLITVVEEQKLLDKEKDERGGVALALDSTLIERIVSSLLEQKLEKVDGQVVAAALDSKLDTTAVIPLLEEIINTNKEIINSNKLDKHKLEKLDGQVVALDSKLDTLIPLLQEIININKDKEKKINPNTAKAIWVRNLPHNNIHDDDILYEADLY